MPGIDAFGTVWSISTDGGSTYTPVADVTNIQPLNAKADTIDVSSHDSPSGWREFVGAMKDGGALAMDINYDPAVHGLIFSHFGAMAPLKMKVALTDTGSHVVAFSAVIDGFAATAPFDGKLGAAITLKVSGIPTITP